MPGLWLRGANGTLAARQACYGAAGASKQATRLLQNPDVAERIGEYHAEQAAARAEMSRALMDKLEPVYKADLEAGDNETCCRRWSCRRVSPG